MRKYYDNLNGSVVKVLGVISRFFFFFYCQWTVEILGGKVEWWNFNSLTGHWRISF